MATAAARLDEFESLSEPVESARAAGLRYTSDAQPGFRRRRAGEGFVYLDAQGDAIDDEDVVRRIKRLAIPPAWTDVWICPSPRGHLQATGRDARGRKQYRYHPRWREVRDETKYHRMGAFGEALPRIRERVQRDLDREGLPREKVLATLVRLLDLTWIRIGNEEYAKENGSIGLTTMRTKHVDIEGSTLRFRFRGKGGKEHAVDVRDRRLARIVKQCREIPGYELFQYLDDNGERHSVESEDVNAYLREVSSEDFTAKDFRTWAGTVLAVCALRKLAEGDTAGEGVGVARKHVVEAIKQVAGQLRNTPAVCRKSYVHPRVLESYEDGSLMESCQRRFRKAPDSPGLPRPEEAIVLALLTD